MGQGLCGAETGGLTYPQPYIRLYHSQGTSRIQLQGDYGAVSYTHLDVYKRQPALFFITGVLGLFKTIQYLVSVEQGFRSCAGKA